MTKYTNIRKECVYCHASTEPEGYDVNKPAQTSHGMCYSNVCVFEAALDVGDDTVQDFDETLEMFVDMEKGDENE